LVLFMSAFWGLFGVLVVLCCLYNDAKWLLEALL